MGRSSRTEGSLPFDVSLSDPKDRIQDFIDRYRGDPDYQGFDGTLMRNIKVISAVKTDSAKDDMEARAVFEIDVVPGLQNPMRNMHGGAVALLVDMATSLAIAPITQKDFWEFAGVSRTLQVTYINPIPAGTTITVDCMLRGIGRRLAVIQCIIKNKATGNVLAVAEHGKVGSNPQQPRAEEHSKL